MKGGEELKITNRPIIRTKVGWVRVVSEQDGIDETIRVNITDLPFEMDSDENIDVIIGLDLLQRNNVKLIFGK